MTTASSLHKIHIFTIFNSTRIAAELVSVIELTLLLGRHKAALYANYRKFLES